MTQLPTGWAPARVEDLVADGGITDGPFGSNLKTAHYRDSGPRVIRLQNVGDGVFRDERAHIEQDHYERLVKHAALPGDVLIASLGETLPRACLAPDIGPAIVKADVIRARTASGASSAYLMWALNSPQIRERVANQIKGVGRPRFSLGGLRVLEIPLAPAAEQERIVAAIEEAFSLLDAGETALHNTRTRLKRMRESVLTAAVTGQLVPQDPTDTPADKFIAELGVGPGVPDDQLPGGWTWIALGDILRSIEAGKSFAAGGRPADKGELGVIKVSAMTWGSFRASENKVLPAGTVIDLRWIVRQGDVLLSRANTSEYVGACVLVPRDYPNLILSDKSLRLVPERGIDPSWLVHTLRARACRRQIEALATGTKESMRNISQDKLRVIRIALPPPEEQARIVTEVERQFSFIEDAERAVDAALARSKGLRRSVLKAAFEGRLVEQDPADEPASVLLARIATERAAMAPRKRAPRAVQGKVVAS